MTDRPYVVVHNEDGSVIEEKEFTRSATHIMIVAMYGDIALEAKTIKIPDQGRCNHG